LPELFPDVGAGVWAVDQEKVDVAVGAGVDFLDALADRLVGFVDGRSWREDLGCDVDV